MLVCPRLAGSARVVGRVRQLGEGAPQLVGATLSAAISRLYFATVAGLSEFTVTWLALKSRSVLPVEFDFASG